MDSNFWIPDIANIQFHGIPNRIHAQLVETFPSYLDTDAGEKAQMKPLVLEFVPELKLPENARYMKSIAYSDTSYYILDNRGPMIHIDFPWSGEMRHLLVSEQIGDALLEAFIENMLHSLAIRSRSAFLHSGAIGVNGQAIVLCAWKGTGKTESVLEFLRRGYEYIGDDWSIISADGTVHAYDKQMALYTHDVAGAPETAKIYYGKLKGQILAWYAQTTSPVKMGSARLSFKERVSRRVLREAVQRMHLKTNIHLTASQISSSNTLASAPLRIVYLMSRANVHDIAIVSLDKKLLVSQALANYRYEMRSIFDPEQLQFAFPSQKIDLGLGIRSDDLEAVWSQAFASPSVKSFAVRIPIHADSKTLVSSLESHINQVIR